MNLQLYLKSINKIYKEYGRQGKKFIATFCPDCNYDGKIYRQIFIYADGNKKGGWKCWRCEKGGDFIKLIMFLESLSYKNAETKFKIYSSLISDDVDNEYDNLLIVKNNVPVNQQELAGEDFIIKGMNPIISDSKSFKYLQRRGFNYNDIDDWELKYCSIGRYKGRIVIPVYHPKVIYRTLVTKRLRRFF